MTTINESPNLEAVQAALKSVKLLRCTVGDVFKSLADFPTVTATDQSANQNNPSEDARENSFINDLQTALSSINAKFRDLESACTLLAHPSLPINITLGSSGLLGQDPIYERTPLYSDMFNSYRWCDKLHEYAAHAGGLLAQNNLKRSNVNSFVFMAKIRPRRLLSTGHNVIPQHVDQFVTNILQRMPGLQDMTMEIARPFGNPLVLKITIARTLKAVILLRGLLIEWVMIKAFSETFEDESNQHLDKRIRRGFESEDKLDIWSSSRYHVFRKVTEHANAAMLHYYSPIHPDLAVKSFVTWLYSYSSLFSAPCHKCGLRLQHNMPPTWRDFRNLEPFHEQCKP